MVHEGTQEREELETEVRIRGDRLELVQQEDQPVPVAVKPLHELLDPGEVPRAVGDVHAIPELEVRDPQHRVHE